MSYRHQRLFIVLLASVAPAIPTPATAGFLWARTYAGTAGDYDAAQSIAALPDGGVVVTGGSQEDAWKATTIAYAPSGTIRWIRHYGTIPYAAFGRGVAVGHDGSVYVAAQQSLPTVDTTDIVLIKYDISGNEEWVRVYDGTGYDDAARFIRVSPAGYILLLGASTQWDGYNLHFDFLLLKYTNQGELLWARRFDGPGHFDDFPNSIVIDSTDYIYITGEVDNTPGPFYDWATLKYSPDGVLAWARLYNGPGDDNDFPSAIALAPDEAALYVTGKTVLTDPYGADAITTIKYDDEGNELWLRTYREGLADYGVGLAVSKSGDIFVTGHSDWRDAMTLSYMPDGVLRWARRYDDPNHAVDLGYFISVTPDGEVFVVGIANNGGGRSDVLVLTYDDAGMLLRDDIYDNPSHWWDGPSSRVLIGDALYISGRTSTEQSWTTMDYLTLKYQRKVVPVSISAFEATAAQGAVQLTWRATDDDWSHFNVERSAGVGTVTVQLNDQPITSDPEASGHYSYLDRGVRAGVRYEYWLIAIDRRGGGAERVGPLPVLVPTSLPIRPFLYPSRPNPFTQSTTVTFDTSLPGPISLLVYDTTGRLIRTLSEGFRVAGRHSVVWNGRDTADRRVSSGVYLALLKTNHATCTEKMYVIH